MSGDVRVDLHVHCSDSPDSSMAIEDVVDRLGPAGLQGFALTDHNTIAGHRRLAEVQAEHPRLWLIPGVELSTREGHLLVYGVHELPPIHRPLAESLDWVRSHGGVAVLAHPFRFSHGVGRRIAERATVSLLEGLNGHSGPIPNANAELLAARRGMGTTGGSDAHDPRGVGRSFTEFPGDVRSVDDVLDRLRARRCRPAGRSLGFGERFRLALRTGALRATRGFRPI